MASIPMDQSSDTRRVLLEHGGENVMHCYQCATCSSVCKLAPADNPFPRRQILLAQWGLFDELMGDPGPWLCHQCNDCSVRCPRDVRPGDVMASVRAMTVERLAFPSFLGSLVGNNVRKTWPLLVFGPILFWVVLLGLVTQFGTVPSHHGLTAGSTMGQFFYEDYVPHWMIYAVNFAAVGFVGVALFVQGSKFWKMMGEKQKRSGSFIAALIGVFASIALHTKFSSCDRGVPKRRWGHFMVMWGFVGAAVASGFAVVFLYRDVAPFSWFLMLPFFDDIPYPVPITHWNKWLANISAILLVVGGLMLLVNRFKRNDKLVGHTTAFDRFFLWIVLAVIGTGVLTEIIRYAVDAPMLGLGVYVLHLGVVLCLFLTLPYSKFAHILYRTLAMAHERMTGGK